MPSDNYSHTDYLQAFQQFLQTGQSEALGNYLQGSRPASFLSVYRNGFIRASVAALQSNFPTLLSLWGEDYFSQVAGAYVTVAPPASATLIGYGFENHPDTSTISFVDFLQGEMTDLMTQFPYVPDMCRLDQAWMDALNADGESYLSLDTVQALIADGVDLSERSMTLVDSAQIVNLQYDVFALWGQLRFGELASEQPIELRALPNTVIFWQREWQVQAKPLSPTETVFMRQLKQSANMDTATQAALADDEAFDISTLFAELLNAHLLQ